MQTLTTVTLDPRAAVAAIKTASKFVISDTLRPALTGVLFEIAPLFTTITACDAWRLYSKEIATGVMQGPQKSITVILDPVSLKKSLDRHFFNMAVETDGNDKITKVEINGAPVTVIDAKYPEYRKIIPRDNSIQYTVGTEALIRAARAGAYINGGGPMQKDNRNWQIIFDFSNTPKTAAVKFSACSIDHATEISGTLGATWPGSDKVPASPAPLFSLISFSGHLLADTLQVLQCDSITLLMEKPNRGVVFETGDDSETVLIMPLMVC